MQNMPMESTVFVKATDFFTAFQSREISYLQKMFMFSFSVPVESETVIEEYKYAGISKNILVEEQKKEEFISENSDTVSQGYFQCAEDAETYINTTDYLEGKLSYCSIICEVDLN